MAKETNVTRSVRPHEQQYRMLAWQKLSNWSKDTAFDTPFGKGTHSYNIKGMDNRDLTIMFQFLRENNIQHTITRTGNEELLVIPEKYQAQFLKTFNRTVYTASRAIYQPKCWRQISYWDKLPVSDATNMYSFTTFRMPPSELDDLTRFLDKNDIRYTFSDMTDVDGVTKQTLLIDEKYEKQFKQAMGVTPKSDKKQNKSAGKDGKRGVAATSRKGSTPAQAEIHPQNGPNAANTIRHHGRAVPDFPENNNIVTRFLKFVGKIKR